MTQENTPSRYILESPAPGYFECRDTKTNVFVTFEEQKYDETQEWYFPADPAIQKPTTMDNIANKMEAWLLWHHQLKLRPEHKYMIQLSEDGKTITVTHAGKPGNPSDPRIVVTFPADARQKSVAAKIRNLAMFLRDHTEDWHFVDFR